MFGRGGSRPPAGGLAGVAAEPGGLHLLAYRVKNPQVGDCFTAGSGPEPVITGDDAVDL